MNRRLPDIYDTLHQRFGPQNWWPAETPFEVVVGAILTQNTNWKNVEKAIANLRDAGALELATINLMPRERLEELIRPSGFFRQKAARLQDFTLFLANEFDGSLDRLFCLDPDLLRQCLLDRPGIGPETADSIILYAAGQPSFVVDAYTHRIFERVGLLGEMPDYDLTRSIFMENLPQDANLFNEFHALIVRLAKEFCRKKEPLCRQCPILSDCQYGQNSQG